LKMQDKKLMDRMEKYSKMPDHDILILNVAMTEQLGDVLLDEGGICDKVQVLAEDNVAMKTYWKITATILILMVPVIIGIVWDLMH